MRLLQTLPVATAALSLLACAFGEPTDLFGYKRVAISPTFEQEVTVTPAPPRTGDVLTVRSTVRNTGPTIPGVESRVCGLDWRGDLQFTPPRLYRCGAYSTTDALARGDTRTERETLGTITSPPGTYTLEIRHLLEPEAWVSMTIVVRE